MVVSCQIRPCIVQMHICLRLILVFFGLSFYAADHFLEKRVFFLLVFALVEGGYGEGGGLGVTGEGVHFFDRFEAEVAGEDGDHYFFGARD